MTANQYNECVHAYADGMYRFALSMLADVIEAEDVVQQVFERFWKRHSEVQFEAAKSYLFTSINRACIDYFRRKKTSRNTRELLPQDDPGISGHDFEARQLVQELLKHLNEEQKTLILLRDYEGYSYKEISEIMNLTVAQVKINLFRTRKKLQIFLTANSAQSM